MMADKVIKNSVRTKPAGADLRPDVIRMLEDMIKHVKESGEGDVYLVAICGISNDKTLNNSAAVVGKRDDVIKALLGCVRHSKELRHIMTELMLNMMIEDIMGPRHGEEDANDTEEAHQADQAGDAAES